MKMLPGSQASWLNALRMIALAVLAASLSGCGTRPEPELAVRTVIEQAESGAEARDVGAVMDLVSDDYSDAAGRDRRALRALVRGYFVVNPQIELLLQIGSVEFPESNRARVRLRATSIGRTQLDAQAWQLDLVEESGEWRLLRAERFRE